MAVTGVANIGAKARAAMKTGDAGDVDWSAGSPYAFPFISESVVKQEQVLDLVGIRGTRTRHAELDRAGTYDVGGTLTVAASPILLENFLPSILGTAKDAAGGGTGIDRYTVADTLIEFGLLIDKVGAIFEFQDCQVSRAVFSGTRDQPISLAMDIVGKEQAIEASWDANIPAIAVLANSDPYIFHDLSLLADGESAIPVNSFTLTIDNVLDVQFRNSQPASAITPQDRIITLSVPVPFNSTTYSGLYAGAETTSTLTLNNGTFQCDFEFAHLNQTKRTPIVPGKQEIGLLLEYEARASAYVAATPSTHDMYVDLDSTI